MAASRVTSNSGRGDLVRVYTSKEKAQQKIDVKYADDAKMRPL
jgi:hypothetical protein